MSGLEPTIVVELLELSTDLASDKDAVVARRLEALYPRIAPSVREGDHKRPSDRSVLFVADPGRIGSTAGPKWRQAAAAVCESYGYDVAFDVTPITNRSATTRQMDLFGGTAIIIVTFAAGSFSSSNGRIQRWAHRTVELDRPQLDDLLDDLRLNFELGLVDPPHVETWEQFAHRAEELEATTFASRANARQHCASVVTTTPVACGSSRRSFPKPRVAAGRRDGTAAGLWLSTCETKSDWRLPSPTAALETQASSSKGSHSHGNRT